VQAADQTATPVTTLPALAGVRAVTSLDAVRSGPSDLLRMVEYGYDAPTMLLELVKKHPDVSKCIWDFINVAETIVTYSANNAAGELSNGHTAWLRAFLEGATLLPVGRGGPSLHDHSPAAFRGQLALLFMLRGAAACEILVNRRAEPIGLYLRDPAYVSFERAADDSLTAIWGSGVNAKSITSPRFFFAAFNPHVDEPSGVSPILPVLAVVYMQLKVLVDLAKIMHKNGWPRTDITVVEKTIMDNIPREYAGDPIRQRGYVETIIANIKADYEKLNPEDGFVHTDSVTVNKNAAGGTQTFDPRALMEVINQQVVAALKSMPSLLGRTAGKTSTYAEAEIEVFRFSAAALQRVSAAFQERVLGACLNMSGRRGGVTVTYAPIELRSRTEIEQWRATQITNECAAWVLGVKTFDDVRRAIANAGGTLPQLTDTEVARAEQFMLARAMGAGDKAVERSGVATAQRDNE
jgi:hypothetical protein